VIWLPVRDMGNALEFYGQTLGLEVEQQEEEWSMLRAGDGTRIALNSRESPSGGGGAVIAFRPADAIESAVESLAAKGVEVAGGVTEHPWGRVATFKDPDGNDLQFYEPPAS
jgi:predicted enzyme related to lactoylglutathione lyase